MAMRVVACLPQEDFRWLQTAAPALSVFAAQLGREPQSGTRLEPGSVMIIDPATVRDDYFDRLIAGARESPAAIIFFTEVSNIRVVGLLLSAAQAGFVNVVLRRPRPAARELASRILRAYETRAAAELLGWLSARIGRLPPKLRMAYVRLFCGAVIPKTVSEFALAQEQSRHTIGRAVRITGLGHAKTLLDGVRLAVYRDMVCCDARPAHQALSDVGFDSFRAANEQCRRLAGVSVSDATEIVPAVEFAERLFRACAGTNGTPMHSSVPIAPAVLARALSQCDSPALTQR